eukprot:GHVT01015974.1.p2 GENE.GHVT01015974.1~~GHVT01015974.1.p2  ORF type:complete len:221 (-),score=26.53 GHVT01015974.1:133-795(-)
MVQWTDINEPGPTNQMVWLYWPFGESQWACMELAPRDEMINMVWTGMNMNEAVDEQKNALCQIGSRRLKESDRDVPSNGHSVKWGIRYDATRAKFLCYDCQQPERLRVPAEQFAVEAGDDPCVGSDVEVCSSGTFGGKVLCGAAVAVSMLSLGLLLGFWWRRKKPQSNRRPAQAAQRQTDTRLQGDGGKGKSAQASTELDAGGPTPAPRFVNSSTSASKP